MQNLTSDARIPHEGTHVFKQTQSAGNEKHVRWISQGTRDSGFYSIRQEAESHWCPGI